MKTTIDTAGRVVIPKKYRDQYHLRAHATVEILPEADGLRLCLQSPGVQLIEKEGVLVERAGSVSTVDSTEFINRERNRHSVRINDNTE